MTLFDTLPSHIGACQQKVRGIQFSSFSGHFREGRDLEIARTEERLEHQMRTTGQLNGSDKSQGYTISENSRRITGFYEMRFRTAQTVFGNPDFHRTGRCGLMKINLLIR